MIRSRQAYTLTEMLIVVVMVGALTLFAIPKFSVLVDRNKLGAAREEITAAIATARTSAIQKGRTATLRFSNNQMWVTVGNANGIGTMTVVPTKSLASMYNVSLTASDTTIVYDIRGFANPRLNAGSKIVIVKGSRRDSVCVTPTGQIMPRRCSL